MSEIKFKKLGKGDKANFETLRRAAVMHDLCLMRGRRKSDGKQVALVCAVNVKGLEHEFAPLAVMVEGNPYELFESCLQEDE